MIATNVLCSVIDKSGYKRLTIWVLVLFAFGLTGFFLLQWITFLHFLVSC